LAVFLPQSKSAAPFLTPDGKLRAALTLRDSQGGFAGYSGELWTISPDGHFTIAHFLNDKTAEPNWKRDLSPEQLKSLAQVLCRNHFLQLPNELGSKPEVNPHSLTLSFGKKQATLVFPAGDPPHEITDPASRRFIAIVSALRDLSKDRPTAP
jgi:hypothetical protein